MADLSEYEDLNDIEFSQDVKQLMELFAESWEECRFDECGACKYRHGKERYKILACISERYAENLIAAGVAPVRHGRWILYYNGGTDKGEFYCSVCNAGSTHNKNPFCYNCGADMRGGGEDA